MKVIGCDTSLTATGIATNTGWCTQVGQDGVTKMPLPQRIRTVDDLVCRILDEAGEADLWVIEEPAFTRSGGGAVERHALYWLLLRHLAKAERRVAVVNPRLRGLYAAGKNGAPKNAVIDAVARRLPMFETAGNDNLCDAAVLCAMGCDWVGAPLAVMPATHRAALNKVAWPELATVVTRFVEPSSPLACEGATHA